MSNDKRIVIMLGIVTISLVITQFFFADKEEWCVYIDDLSVYDETGCIFNDTISDETLKHMVF